VAKIDPTRTATLHRFRGHGGLDRLAEALADQFVVYGDRTIAVHIAKKAEVRAFPVGSTLMEQGDEETSIAFLLAGTVEILVNGHPIAARHAGNHVGEMALLDPLSRRSATVRATELTVAAVVSEYDFSNIAQQHPHLWRRLALSLGERLRERSKFHRPPNKHPAVFIGSSREGLSLAECLYGALRRSPTVPRLWSKGVFECSKTIIEDLTRAANESDFAILVLTGDDMTTSRRARTASPRDNVIFELGLFMGTLGRERTYVLAPSGLDIKIPTDLLGVTFLTYALRPSMPSKRLREPLRIIRGQIKKHGPRRALGAT
jgi:CRP/FNR family transcriptional regulator, cyclic AMP receptor protein